MSEYWKSTPNYWCKFCSQYVRDTAIERKNHESTAKHQNNIQRNLRELHKGKEREEREKQRAKDEVARLNGMFGGGEGKKATATAVPATGKPKVQSALTSNLTAAQQRKAHAEQLAALGVELPEELKKEVTGVGNYQVVNAREVEETEAGSGGAVTVNRSLAEILAEAKREEQESKDTAKSEEEDEEGPSKSGGKRKAEEELEDMRDEEAAPKMRKAWGSTMKTYPGKRGEEEDAGDLDALLSGVKKPKVKAEKMEDEGEVKKEEEVDVKPLSAVPDIEGETDGPAAKTESAAGGAPAIVFKKRKGKK